MIRDSKQFSSLHEGARANATTNYSDWELIHTGPTKLLSVFGYNSLASIQWMQVFDSVAPSRAVTVTAASDIITVNSAPLECFAHGERVVWIGARGITTGTVVYLSKLDDGTASPQTWLGTGIFRVFSTKALALAGDPVNAFDLTSDGAITINYAPIHSFGVAASDNYSMIIPVTGLGVGRGLVVANSTTAALYTGGANNVSIVATHVPLIV